MHRRPRPTARPAERYEENALADVLARSFWDDPVMTWMIPDDATRYHKHRRFYRAELRSVRKRGEVFTTDDQAGASLWCRPDEWRTNKIHMIPHVPDLVRAFGTKIPAALKLLEAIDGAHPRAPHWYLAILGTDPSRQGLGVGGALITTITDRCDAAGEAAYLESSKEVNIPYYERFGFRVTHEMQAGDSPTLWGMWRDPQ